MLINDIKLKSRLLFTLYNDESVKSKFCHSLIFVQAQTQFILLTLTSYNHKTKKERTD